ncbi:BCCT family transporter [Ammoniphilus resinae]|uniref:Choline/glycine/proline betaine transport protein n=1 Tax=Ammoniphilus resinae TaxID=861532 RepID=A0ABS4GNM8_9BACL|nr:BCCT family transporter [Ammoniphilus resinae]MBP1931878.1 choline/glycine/proline betaine transport protein [Ammoniphilus resinae]
MWRYIRENTNPPVFIGSTVVITLFVIVGIVFAESFAIIAQGTLNFIYKYFGWFLILSFNLFLIFVVGLSLTRYGLIKMGPDDSKPEFSTPAWFAMLFTAGMGIGLVYFGVAEPVQHFINPPVGEGGTPAAAQEAINYTFYHWLLHGWAPYIVFALSLAYFSFRKGLPLRPASTFYPLIGDRIYGWIGNTIDIIAIFGTVFGLATSLGFGSKQINSGLNYLFGIPSTVGIQILLIVSITLITTVSVRLGLYKGIRNTSLINMYLAVALALFVIIFGPTLFILNSIISSFGYYFQNLIGTSFNTFTMDKAAADWQAGWTLFYWAWWVSWASFVGMFIARISYGRTLRQFIAGVLLAPVGFSGAWFVIFGGSAIYYILNGNGGELANGDTSTALFMLLHQLPAPSFVSAFASGIGILVVVIFFITSADSASLVIDTLMTGGNPSSGWVQRTSWALLIGIVAAVLVGVGSIIGSDPLSALQPAAVASGFPFVIVLVFMCISLSKALREERLPSIQPGFSVDRTTAEPILTASSPQSSPTLEQVVTKDF